MDNFSFYPIYQVLQDTSGRGMIVGKNGSLTLVIKLHCPEAYSLDKEDIEIRHSLFTQAFSHMPDNSFIHKQDIFQRNRYNLETIGASGASYLAKVDYEHFAGREYLTHTCMIGFTLAGLDSLSQAYTSNPFSFKEDLCNSDKDKLSDFLGSVEFAINNISSLRNTTVSFLSVDEIKKYVFLSANFYDDKGIKDIHFTEEITSGNIKARMYAITDEELLPDNDCNVFEKDYTISRDKSELYMTMAESFAGIHISHNHTFNQILYFYSDKKLKDNLQKNYESYESNKNWDRMVLPKKAKALGELCNEIKDNKEVLCYAHYSLLLWDEDVSYIEKTEKEIRSALDIHNIKCYIPSYTNLATLYGAGIMGCVASLPRGYMFETSLSLAVCLFSHYTVFENDPEGILFNDRLFQIPLRKDIWDSKKKRIPARNAIVIAPTGSGKSFITNNIVYQLLDSGFTIVAVEFGNSFKQLCSLYSDISVHVEYEQDQPLGINPFDLEGEELTQDREEFLLTLCLRFWRGSSDNVGQTVALRKFLGQYYREIQSGNSFQGFYFFVKNNFKRLCLENEIEESFFNLSSFLLICSEFTEGGAYANLCSTIGVASNLKDKSFIHFELTKIKSSPFVSSIVMSLLFHVINDKILTDKTKKGYIIFDEYAETAQMKSINPLDTDIHQTVALFYQKIRKDNGAVMTIIQSPVQLPDNEFTKGIIANTKILYVLEGTEGVYKAIIDTFSMTNQSQINQMKSIQNNYNSQYPYSECWIRFGDNYSITVRLEASKRKFLAFQTEGEIRSTLDKIYESNGHDMQQAIEQYLVEPNKKQVL